MSTVRFEHTVIADLTLDEPVDAVIGRLILMHLPDPVAVLRQLAALVRPGGLIAFSEFDTTAASSVPDLPLWRAARDGIGATFTGMGLDPAFGTTLHRLFQRAGLGRPRLTLSAPLGTVDDTDTMAFVAETWRSLFPAAQGLGLAVGGLADPDTLMARLREEVAATNALVQMPALITAWARV